MATKCLMSVIALRIVVLPEAFAPNTPADGSTRTGLLIPTGVINRGTRSAESLVANIDKCVSSRYERAFSVVKDSSALVAGPSVWEVTGPLLRVELSNIK